MNLSEEQRLARRICIVLALGTFFLFCPIMGHEFISLDDGAYVVQNGHIRTGLSLANVWWAFSSSFSGNWHPLTWISHMLDCQLFGLAHPGLHHLENLLFHIANTLLLFAVLRRMTGAMWRSAMVAALFAWHPMHVESVAWASERKDVLCAFFWFLTMLWYVRYAEEKKAGGAKAKGLYGLTLVWFVLGLMSKPMIVTLPCVLLLMDFWPLNRMTEQTEGGNRIVFSRLKPLLLEKVPFFLLVMASSVVTFFAQKRGGAVATLQVMTFQMRIGNALLSYVRYLGKILWPTKLAFFYPLQTVPTSIWVASAAFLVIASAMVIAGARRKPWALVGWFWFLGTLVPVIGLVQVGKQGLADRYTYLPSIGIFIMLAWAGAEIIAKWPALRPSLITAAASALVLLSVATAKQITYWQNTVTLFTRSLELTPGNVMALDNLAIGLEKQGRYEEAIPKYQEALRLEPNSAATLHLYGLNCSARGHVDEAIEYYKKALSLLDDATIRYNLGNALIAKGKFDEAREQYVLALKQEPDSPDIENNLGAVLMRQGKLDEAMGHFQKAIRLLPKYPEAHDQLAAVYEKKGQLDLARVHYAEAVRLKPDFAHAQLRLGLVMAELGYVVPAIPHFQEAIKLESTNGDAYFDLGAAYAALENWTPAVQAFEEAARLKPGSAEIKRRLAEAQSKAPK